MTRPSLDTLRTVLLAGAFCLLSAAAVHAHAPAAGVDPHLEGEVAPSGWIVDEADNVCGVRAQRQITNPASVRYEELLDATPEVQRMKRENISRDSAQGQVLHAAAVDRVGRAARKVMASGSYCGVWKQIRHRDGRAVPDVTSDVRAEL